MPVIAKIDRKLSGVANFMNYAGRLTYVNSVIASMPIFAMCTFRVHITILEHVNKSSRKFLWHGKDIDSKGNYLASWSMICRPKEQGGLGILNLKIQNIALLIKQLHKFYNHADVPWVNLIWQVYYSMNDIPHACKNKGSFWWKEY